MAEKKSEKMVTIHLFRDSGKYSRDQVVGIGGKITTIKRGVDVEVPESVAKVLERSLKQDNATAELIYKNSKKSDGE